MARVELRSVNSNGPAVSGAVTLATEATISARDMLEPRSRLASAMLLVKNTAHRTRPRKTKIKRQDHIIATNPLSGVVRFKQCRGTKLSAADGAHHNQRYLRQAIEESVLREKYTK